MLYQSKQVLYILRNINEEKRRVQNQMLMFEVVEEISDCPVSFHLYSQICKRMY